MLKPRDYQEESYIKALTYMRQTPEPGVLVLTTAAGKSIIVAMLANVVSKAGKRVLCLAPNGDLVSQNAEKYRATGEHCSIFSASLNRKHTGHSVVFATPLSVINALDRFEDEYALVIIDECHGVSDEDETAYQIIISHLQSKNSRLRVLGLTATPMRGKEKLIGENNTFKEVIHELPHHVLSGLGWVVPYSLGKTIEHYDLINLKQQNNGKFKQSEIDAATLGQERLTRLIVNDVQRIMELDNRKCAMIFASSVKHGEEILSYLRDGSAHFIGAKTSKKERKQIIDETRKGKWRFLITVTALGTGTDIPVCDTVVFLRATESIGLLLQFMGRGCRLYDDTWTLPPAEMNWKHPAYQGKRDCLVLDYGENLERFALDDDLTITGLIEAKNKQDDTDDYFPIACPECGAENRHTAQRCVGVTSEGIRCDYRFIFKECNGCGVKNSPSARHCFKCEAELIDPNDKLTRTAAIAAGTAFQVAVMEMSLRPHYKGDSTTLRIDYKVTDGGKTWTISEFKKPGTYPWHKWTQQVRASGNTIDNVVLEAPTLDAPTRLLTKKKKKSKYYEVVALYFDSKNQLDALAA